MSSNVENSGSNDKTQNSDNTIAEGHKSVKKRSKRWVGLLVASAVFVAVVLYLESATDEIDVTTTEDKTFLPTVSIAAIKVQPETIEVRAFSQIKPRWSAEVKAAVSGTVTQVFDAALAGEKVKKGTMLVNIEDSQYSAEVAAAELAVKEARLELSKAEKATQVERKLYQQNGIKPPNDLALHLPQLEIAKSEVKLAKARVTAAKIQYRQTKVIAPFSGYVTQRSVSPGQSVNMGDSLLTIWDDSIFELTAELSRKDWLLLKKPLAGLSARIENQSGETIAMAKVRRVGGFLDETTRQYKVFLEINEPNPDTLYSGEFVRVFLPGITVDKALNIPESALTQEGYLWFLDEQDQLQKISPRVLYHLQDRIIISAPDTSLDKTQQWRIAVTPLASFLPGRPVIPKLQEQ